MLGRSAKMFCLVIFSFSALARAAEAFDFQKIYDQVKKDEAVLVDLREEDELTKEGLAQGALWLPTSVAESRRDGWQAFVKRTKKDQPIYLYCRSGGRAGKVKTQLEKEGFTQVFNIGGLKDWKAHGLPIIQFKQSGKPLDRGHD